MLKKLSENKTQILIVLLLAAVVTGRNLVVLFGKGNPGIYVLLYCIFMSVFYATLFFGKIPLNKEGFFTGRGLIGVISALVIFVMAFTRFNITHDLCLTLMAMFGIAFCSTDVKFMPVAAVGTLAMTVFGYETAVFNVAPWAIAISFIVAFPALKGAEVWKKLVFAATQICSAAMLAYNIYLLRFNFSFQTAKSYLLTTIIMIVFAVIFVALAIISLKNRKASSAREKKKAVKAEKPEYAAAFGYIVAAVFTLLCTLHESRIVICGIVGILTGLTLICESSTRFRVLADNVAGAIGGVADKTFSASEAEE